MGWVTVLGLFFDLVGAIVLASGLFLSQQEAIELGVSRLAGDTEREMLDLPQVKDRLRQSRNAKLGLSLLVIGLLLQIVAAWPT